MLYQHLLGIVPMLNWPEFNLLPINLWSLNKMTNANLESVLKEFEDWKALNRDMIPKEMDHVLEECWVACAESMQAKLGTK